MIRLRSHIAWFVLATFVTGSLFAPLSHYTFMLVSDAYHVSGIGSHAGTTDDVTGDHAHHRSGHHGAHHHEVHPSTRNEAAGTGWLTDADNAHVGCEYADLFATFSAPGLPAAAMVFRPTVTQVLDQTAEIAPWLPRLFSVFLRGPPSLLFHG